VVETGAAVLAAGQVRVNVRSAGVNFADCVVRMGLYESAAKYVGWPITPGFEFAGVVVEVAADVADVAIGDEVVGVTRFGAYASEVIVPRAQLTALPEGFSMRDAGGFPVAFLTAWYALRELAKLRPGMTVLVHSAAGGVGGAALQIVRACDCIPIGVVGAPHKIEVARRLGAAHVIDKSRGRLWSEVERVAHGGVDVVLDPNGAETLRASYEHLAPMGRLIIYGFQSMLSKGRGTPNWLRLAVQYLRTPRFDPLRLTNDNKAVLAFNLSYLFDHLDRLSEAYEELHAWAASQRIVPLPTVELPLESVADAHRALESGTTTGKLVLIP
jgi:NADPH:quinone reductase-like Zn-dependent oxidoreductase